MALVKLADDDARQGAIDRAIERYGRVIEASPTAFNYDDFHKQFPELTPKPGDLVWIARYAGGEMVGKDGRRYRIVKDKDVGGVIDPPA